MTCSPASQDALDRALTQAAERTLEALNESAARQPVDDPANPGERHAIGVEQARQRAAIDRARTFADIALTLSQAMHGASPGPDSRS